MLLVDGEQLLGRWPNLAGEYFVGSGMAASRPARPQLRSERPARRAGPAALRPRLELRGPSAAAPLRRPAGRRRTGHGSARPTDSERPGPGRRHGPCAAGVGRFHGARAHPRGHAVLRPRCTRDGAQPAARRSVASICASLRARITRLADSLAPPLRASRVPARGSCASPWSCKLSSSTTAWRLRSPPRARSLFLHYALMVAFYRPADVARSPMERRDVVSPAFIGRRRRLSAISRRLVLFSRFSSKATPVDLTTGSRRQRRRGRKGRFTLRAGIYSNAVEWPNARG